MAFTEGHLHLRCESARSLSGRMVLDTPSQRSEYPFVVVRKLVTGKEARAPVARGVRVQRQEFVIGGFKPNVGNVESILVGYYDSRKLLFASKVRAGPTPHTRAEIFDRVASQPDDGMSVCESSEQRGRALGARASRPKTWPICAR
jgi:hypothetical protein